MLGCSFYQGYLLWSGAEPAILSSGLHRCGSSTWSIKYMNSHGPSCDPNRLSKWPMSLEKGWPPPEQLHYSEGNTLPPVVEMCQRSQFWLYPVGTIILSMRKPLWWKKPEGSWLHDSTQNGKLATLNHQLRASEILHFQTVSITNSGCSVFSTRLRIVSYTRMSWFMAIMGGLETWEAWGVAARAFVV